MIAFNRKHFKETFKQFDKDRAERFFSDFCKSVEEGSSIIELQEKYCLRREQAVLFICKMGRLKKTLAIEKKEN